MRKFYKIRFLDFKFNSQICNFSKNKFIYLQIKFINFITVKNTKEIKIKTWLYIFISIKLIRDYAFKIVKSLLI
jgi:hypothetical protein